MSALELTDYVDRYVIDRFKNLTGVADVQIFGERRYAMRIWLDRDRLAGYGLTVQDVEGAHPTPERRDPGRAHRKQRPRVHRPVQDRPQDAGGIRQHHHQDGRAAIR